MAKSYTTGRNLYGTLTKNTATANLSFGDQVANDDYRAICAMRDWPWLERLRTLTTLATIQDYVLPYDCDQVKSISVVVSGTTYIPRKAPSQEFWDGLNEVDSTSDIPEWYNVFSGSLSLWPVPATAGSTIQIAQKTRVIDLSVADYTTGTIATATAGSTAIVGSGTSWNASMVGRWIRITSTATANTGDGLWYEIAGVTDTTNLTLTRKYGGTSIVAGSAAYTIGQMALLPESFHDLPWLWAAGHYWVKEGDNRGQSYLELHGNIGSGMVPSTGRIKSLEGSWSNSTTDYVLDDGGDKSIINPNLTISI